MASLTGSESSDVYVPASRVLSSLPVRERSGFALWPSADVFDLALACLFSVDGCNCLSFFANMLSLGASVSALVTPGVG